MHSALLIIPILWSLCPLTAQEPGVRDWRALPLRRPQPLNWQERGFEVRRSRGKIVELALGAAGRLPLLRPVSEWQIAALPGQVYVILAGGIRESLDLYLFESKTGSVEVIGTEGGRMLPSDFGDGQGSWPLFEGRALVVFPYEKDDRLHVTVVNFEGQLLARQILPLEVGAFDVEFNRSSYEVRVRFDTGGEQLTFLHPAAPRLVIDTGLLIFAAAERRGLLLRNQGRRPLQIDLRLDGQGYRIIGPSHTIIPASSSREITVEMVLPADARAQLAITSPVRGVAAVIGLQNLIALEQEAKPLVEVDAPVTIPTIAEPQVTESSPVDANFAPEEHIQPESREIFPELIAAQCAQFEVRRIDGGRVEVSGRPMLGVDFGDQPQMLVRNRRSGEVESAEIASDSSFRITIAAVAGDQLACALAGPAGETVYRDLAAILPILRSEGGALIAEDRPGAELMLLEVVVEGARKEPSRVLRSWRVHLDAKGRVRIPLRSLGARAGPRSFLLLSRCSGGALSQTQVVSVPAEFNQHR